MPDFAMIGANRFETGANTSSTGGITLTSGGSAHTKGNYAEIIASTLFDAQWIIVQIGWWSGAAADHLVDVAIGGAGSETVIAHNLIFTGFLNTDHVAYFMFPIFVPAGSRISARTQATTASRTVRCAVTIIGQGFLPSSPLGVITTYGANTADSGGVQVDPGAAADTKGAYSELTSSLSFDTNWIVLGIGGQNNQARTSARFLLDIAVGSAGNEVVLIPDLFINAQTGGDCILPGSICLPCSIPAGSRVSIRAQCSITDATDRLFDAALYGVS